MIILTDAFGLLIIIILGFQGYKDGASLQNSYILPALLSFTIFYKIFAFVYAFFLIIIPNTVVSGMVTTILINFSLTLLFHTGIIKVTIIFQQHFFLPEIKPHTRCTIGTVLGVVAGYIFVTGAVTSLEGYTHNKLLQESIFYRMVHHPKQYIVHEGKIDNIPSLKELYSEQNVVRFNFTEQELIAVLQMVRAISNQDAQSILQQIHGNANINEIYKMLIDLYVETDQSQIEEKYIVSYELIQKLQEKIGYSRQEESKAKIANNKIKSISDIIDMI